MSKRTIEKIEPSEQTKRIIELAREALAGATEARKRIRLSVDAAFKCGKLLIAEKRLVTKELGKGYWMSYFEINFGKVLPMRTSQHWMKLATEGAIAHSTNGDSGDDNESEKGENKLLLTRKSMPEENLLRLGMLSLELFPKKVALVSVAHATLAPRLTSHLALLARLEEWIDSLEKQAEPMTQSQIEQLRNDFRKTHEFCVRLFE